MLYQKKYAPDILEEIGMLDCKLINTYEPEWGGGYPNPWIILEISWKVKLLNYDQSGFSLNIANMINSFLLLDLYNSHWDVVVRILRYINESLVRSLVYVLYRDHYCHSLLHTQM